MDFNYSIMQETVGGTFPMVESDDNISCLYYDGIVVVVP